MNQSTNMQALAQYTKINVQTGIDGASPYRLICMLLDGALARIATAKGCIKQEHIPRKGENISGAIAIIGGLRDSLDHEVGGELAVNLDSLYSYMTERLLEANAKNDESALDEVHGLLMEIKTAWDQIGDPAETGSQTEASLEQEQRKAG